ncbi:MAG: hypothetical protein G8D61_20065 [gamma proteobacterium symbiont of Ctena orbiculata]|nr:hypothetical protein [Candidatus Thiodiazotropha taylori]MBT3059325.1 hypothetical protein [Candidatus Thiodiazotropha sp. (ex Lucina pensylvanica)]MBT3061376.1 hypothetical protein [Candidatus Thiodiazotropha sp. (ex Lucina pensylvanica)]PUB74843.1 MAG: hypothetical protein DBP03_09000 [gamma proteobacterium symbiont of Ctena orbiculata]PUB76870.1 MAG: hypothetical protein DBO99_12275 [gamma proteobacterium symbiont of Ctena orbiculata]
MTFRITTLSAAIICLLALPASADVLLIESIHSVPINSEEGIPRPKRSMSMDQVAQRYGQPVTAYPSVGEPPITRWDYSGYSVFFEYDLVLTSVVHR